MTNRPRAIGTEGETKVTNYLKQVFPTAHRLVLAGTDDIGDIGGVPDLTIQVKWHAKGVRLAAWVDAAARQSFLGRTQYYCVIHRRVGKGDAAKAYVTLPLEVFAPIYAAAARRD